MTLFFDSSHELINLFKIVIDHGVTAGYFAKQIFSHPTISEGLNDLFAQL